MLDLVGLALVSNGIMFCRLDGSMSLLQRNNTLADFSTNPQVIVILVSLMAGGVGYVTYKIQCSIKSSNIIGSKFV